MGDVSLGTAPTEEPADQPQKSEWDLPEFDITIHQSGKATILMDGVPLKMTRGVQVYQHVGEFPEVVITYLAGHVRLRGPARHAAIIQPIDLDIGPAIPLTLATDGTAPQAVPVQSAGVEHVWMMTPADWDEKRFDFFCQAVRDRFPKDTLLTILPPGVTVAVSSLPSSEKTDAPTPNTTERMGE